jgi:protein-L-isoaspartate O-methyltransferase
MIIPVGPHGGDQKLILITKDEAGGSAQREVLQVAFVPLTSG